MKDRVAIVTGGSSGIGRAIVLAFARRGVQVVVGDVQTEAGEATVRAVLEAGGEAIFRRTDVSQRAEVEALVRGAVERFGGLDFLVNNAGVEGEQALTADTSEANWDRVLAINLKGVWLGMRAAIPVLLERGGGAIVNVSSVAGLVGFRGLPAYVASKHGILGLTKTAALEYAERGIRVNAVCPGVIQTAMIDRFIQGRPEVEAQFRAMEPVGRLGRPEEVAEAVVWLCSQGASFVTGAALTVDGGLVAQ